MNHVLAWVRRLLLALTLGGLSLNVGCATIVTGGKHPIRFQSDPPGATVRCQGMVLGKTPCVANVKGIPEIEFQLDGYQPRIVNPGLSGQYRIVPAYWGNCLWCLTLVGSPIAVIGVLVDYSNDNWVELESPFGVTLYPIATGAPPQNSAPISSDASLLNPGKQ